MARVSPVRKLHIQAEAAMLPYGPATPTRPTTPTTSTTPTTPTPPPSTPIEVVATYGEVAEEYAAIRKGCIVLDEPTRATLELTGADRLEFLQRMVTQDVAGMPPFTVRRSFWLNRKGRIDADLRVIELGDRTLIDLDAHAAARTVEGLGSFVITEDVAIKDLTESMHRLSLHGPTSIELLKTVGQAEGGTPIADLAPDRASIMTIAGHRAIIDRDDATGEIGLSILLPVGGVQAVFEQLIEAGHDHAEGGDSPGARIRLRPAGWYAFNMARIENGRPLYYIDFGPDSLPHESGVLLDRVSFKKGCYLGQEIVARMESRGHSKQKLMAFRVLDGGEPEARQPVTGSQLYREPGGGDPIGVVTSSTVSPMLGSIPIFFAMVRHPYVAPGATAHVDTDRGRVPATAQAELRFWSRESR